jgi:hypothetical protein
MVLIFNWLVMEIQITEKIDLGLMLKPIQFIQKQKGLPLLGQPLLV